MIGKLRRWWRFNEPFRRSFGLLRGLRIASAMADVEYRRPAGELVSVPVWPGERPVFLRARSADIDVFRQVIVGRELAVNLAPAPRRILDAGANIGLSVRTFVRQWPQAEILAVEFEPGNVAVLRQNCAHLSQVSIAPVALWYGSDWVRVANPDAEAHSYSATPAGEGDAGVVPARGVGDLLRDLGWSAVDLLKLDIEGAERCVLDASAQWLPLVQHLVVELHDRTTPGCSEALDRALGDGDWDRSTHGEYVIASRRSPGRKTA